MVLRLLRSRVPVLLRPLTTQFSGHGEEPRWVRLAGLLLVDGEVPMSNDDILRALPRDTPDYHARQAAHLRALAENATTDQLKAQLLELAERHEQLAATINEPQ